MRLLEVIKNIKLLREMLISFYREKQLTLNLKDLSTIDEIFSITVIEYFLNDIAGIYINIYKDHYDIYIPSEHEQKFKNFLVHLGWDINKVNFVFVEEGEIYIANKEIHNIKDIMKLKHFVILKLIKLFN